jgi:hypothetical protein
MALPLGNILLFSNRAACHSGAWAKPANPESGSDVIGVCILEVPAARYARPGTTWCN